MNTALALTDFEAPSASPISERVRVAPRVARPVDDALMSEYLPLVRQEVARMVRRVPSHVQREDLVSAANFGLYDALRKYAHVLDDRFERYARIRIRGAILDELRTLDWLSRSARAEATERGETATMVDIDDVPLGDMGTQPDRSHDRQAMAALITSTLPEREATIVVMYYYEEASFKDLALLFHVSEARISQLHSQAMRRLRAEIEGERASA